MNRKKILEALGEAYDEARYGGISDGGGSEPLQSKMAAEVILEYLESAGLTVAEKQ